MGAWAGLSDGPALLFRMLQGFTNMLVRMGGHFLLLRPRYLFLLVEQSYHYSKV